MPEAIWASNQESFSLSKMQTYSCHHQTSISFNMVDKQIYFRCFSFSMNNCITAVWHGGDQAAVLLSCDGRLAKHVNLIGQKKRKNKDTCQQMFYMSRFFSFTVLFFSFFVVLSTRSRRSIQIQL